MVRRNKYFLKDVLEGLKLYMTNYSCSFSEAVCDLDNPITHQEVRDLAKMANEVLTEDQVQKLGRSEREVSGWEAEEQRQYNYERGDI